MSTVVDNHKSKGNSRRVSRPVMFRVVWKPGNDLSENMKHKGSTMCRISPNVTRRQPKLA
eukprot:2055963-Amphidinium_carterae.2